MAEINLQWKGTEACYDFYCDCNPEFPQHADGFFKQEFTCGMRDERHEDDPEWEALTFCGKLWHLPNLMIALPGPFVSCKDDDKAVRGD